MTRTVDATGTVKWFNDEKGFGFIRQDTGEDCFVHHSEIRMDGRRALEGGQRVVFDVHSGAKGLAAANVRLEK